jgi:hypothetical protein
MVTETNWLTTDDTTAEKTLDDLIAEWEAKHAEQQASRNTDLSERQQRALGEFQRKVEATTPLAIREAIDISYTFPTGKLIPEARFHLDGHAFTLWLDDDEWIVRSARYGHWGTYEASPVSAIVEAISTSRQRQQTAEMAAKAIPPQLIHEGIESKLWLLNPATDCGALSQFSATVVEIDNEGTVRIATVRGGNGQATVVNTIAGDVMRTIVTLLAQTPSDK